VIGCRTHQISSASKTGDKSDDPGLALIAGTLLSWARVNNDEFISYPDDTLNREEILIACNDGKITQPLTMNLSDCSLIAVLKRTL
jgi:hypothetical protein